MSKTFITDNLKTVHERIRAACERGHRDPNGVQLIDVSKTKPVEMLKEAYDDGERHFGENKVQELVLKYEQLPKDIKWHMIGHLQRNKVKYIVDKVALIHSVDSVRLAEEIHKEAMKIGRRVPVLIEVNVAGEETKFGVAPEEVEELIRKIAPFEGIEVQGLMTIAPFVTNPEENRQYFNRLKQLSVDISHKNIDNINMNVLSMGMTGDYEVAIEEGASFVRVGTGIFGERNYTI